MSRAFIELPWPDKSSWTRERSPVRHASQSSLSWIEDGDKEFSAGEISEAVRIIERITAGRVPGSRDLKKK